MHNKYKLNTLKNNIRGVLELVEGITESDIKLEAKVSEKFSVVGKTGGDKFDDTEGNIGCFQHQQEGPMEV